MNNLINEGLDVVFTQKYQGAFRSPKRLKDNANKAFEMAESVSVVLLSRTQPKAVMVSPDRWNSVAQELNDLRELVAALRAEQDISTLDA